MPSGHDHSSGALSRDILLISRATETKLLSIKPLTHPSHLAVLISLHQPLCCPVQALWDEAIISMFLSEWFFRLSPSRALVGKMALRAPFGPSVAHFLTTATVCLWMCVLHVEICPTFKGNFSRV